MGIERSERMDFRRTSKIYIYKMTVDDGGAPCLRDGILSLAICKPAIRSAAKPGSLVLGFAGNELYKDNCLVYAAKVTETAAGQKYFSEPRYAARPDCIYRWDGRRFEWKQGSNFHRPDHLTHDLGEAPEYGRANVLLSEGAENFRYFREKCPLRYKKDFPHLKSLVENLMRGHRSKLEPNLQSEVRRFISRAWHEPSAYRETAIPDAGCKHKCGGDDDDIVQFEC
jgi:hypothetical protein